MPQAIAPTPYCGLPPAPGGVAWNLDPLLIAALLALLLAAWPFAAGRRRWLLAGWGVAAALLVSPLCNLSVALFSARVAQHLGLLAVAAPLLALALARPAPGAGQLALAGFAFALALWGWHLPGPYDLTFRSDLAYWAMQASLTGAAAWLWHGLLRGAEARPEAVLLAGMATAAQMGGLGALLTFAPRPLFLPHGLTTFAWGLTPLEDQQLGGLLMWVPGGLAFALVALPALGRALRADPAAP